MKQIRIGYLSTLYHTSHILRAQQRLERDLGLAPRWELFGTGPAMLESFSRGGLDLGYLGLPPAMIGMGRGIALKCIAGGHAEGTVMVGPAGMAAAADERGITGVLEQCAGKVIGAPARGSIHDIIIRHLLERCGIAGAGVKNYPWADLMPQAIAECEIAAAVGTPPLAAVAESWYGCGIVIPPRLLWPFNPSYGILARTELLQERSLLEGFIGLHEAACNLIRKRPEEAAALLADAVQVVGAEFIRKVFAISPRYCAALPEAYREASLAFVPVLRQQGLMNRSLAAHEVFDPSFVERVHPGPHHY